MASKPRLFGVLLKAALLFALFSFAFLRITDVPLGKLTLYNSFFPGRERFPFGETRESYNLSLFDLDAMFASHILDGTPKTTDEYRVLLIGDVYKPEPACFAGKAVAHDVDALDCDTGLAEPVRQIRRRQRSGARHCKELDTRVP